MEDEKNYQEHSPILEWYDAERKMAIIARMTADREHIPEVKSQDSELGSD